MPSFTPTTNGGCTAVFINAREGIELGVVDLIQANLDGLDLAGAAANRQHDAGALYIHHPSTSFLITIEARYALQITAPFELFCYNLLCSDRRCCPIPQGVNVLTGESPPKQGLSVCGTQGEQGQQIAVCVVSGFTCGNGQFRTGDYKTLLAFYLSYRPIHFSTLIDPAELFIGCIQGDLMDERI